MQLFYLINESKVWKIVSVLDEFNQETITQKVKKMFKKFDGKDMKVSDFNYILFCIMKYYVDQITIEIIESMTYKFFHDLIIISEEKGIEYMNVEDTNSYAIQEELRKSYTQYLSIYFPKFGDKGFDQESEEETDIFQTEANNSDKNEDS